MYVPTLSKIFRPVTRNTLTFYLALLQDSVLIGCAKKPLISMLTYPVLGLNFGLSFHLYSYFVTAGSKGSCKSAHLRRLA